MLTFKNVFLIKTPNRPFTKGLINNVSSLTIFICTFSLIFRPMDPFQIIDYDLCLTSMLPNFIMCSIRKLKIEWWHWIFTWALNDYGIFCYFILFSSSSYGSGGTWTLHNAQVCFLQPNRLKRLNFLSSNMTTL